MKYESITKTKRNQQIIKYRKDNPQESFEEIGEVFIKDDGTPLSKQRVHQICKRGY